MKKFIFTLILASGLWQAALNAQTNPFYVSAYANPNPEHWMMTGYADSITGSWSYLTPLSQPLFGVNSYYWSQNNKVFICGGATQDVVPQSACWWYDPANNTYEAAASLPQGRWSGKLVRVRDSLYLIGSVDSTFSSADSLVFKYSLNENTWVRKADMPRPYVHECAVAVINDSLIVTVGGSTNSFVNPVNYVKVYNPWSNRWSSSSSVFPVTNTTSHAECLRNDSSATDYIIVFGGYGNDVLTGVYRGAAILGNSDSLTIIWDRMDSLNTPLFGRGMYRVAGAKMNNYALFGPGMNGSSTVNHIWALKLYNQDFAWTRLDPGTIDTAGNISSYGVKTTTDSNYLFLFGGFRNPNVVSSAKKYAFITPPPPPIGVTSQGGVIPENYELSQNFPNPFNPVTKIKFSIPAVKGFESQSVKIVIYDIAGRELSVLINEELKAGNYEVEFDGTRISSGVYFYKLSAGKFFQTKKMMFIK